MPKTQKMHAPAWKLNSGASRSQLAVPDDTPGPGQYFPAKAGDACSEISRFGHKTLANASQDYAKKTGGTSTAPRFDDDF